jgi:hypothetical protein
MRRMVRTASVPALAALLAGCAAMGLVGCSQVAALAPVGGDRVSSVRYAVADLLVAADVEVLTAPVCSSAGADVTCKGEAADGSRIEASAPGTEQDLLKVSIGDRVLYDGSLQKVLDDALEGKL